MILLDTNVISALMRREPDETVVAWLDDQPAESVWTTTVTVFQIRFGLEIIAAGKRRQRLQAAFTKTLNDDLAGRVLAFDSLAAEAAAAIAARQRRAGRPIEIRDVQIAGIASARKATLATGNTRHFEGADVSLVNPWGDAPHS